MGYNQIFQKFEVLKKWNESPNLCNMGQNSKRTTRTKKFNCKTRSRKNNGEENLVICGNKIIAKPLPSDQSYHPFPSKAQDFWASLF